MKSSNELFSQKKEQEGGFKQSKAVTITNRFN